MKKKDQAFDQLVDDIKSSINADISGSGFHSINCPMCENKDQTQKKGGFKFEHEQIGYNCFRGSCDAPTVYTMGERIPRKFRDLMDEIGVQIPIELRATGKKRKAVMEVDDDRYEKNVYKTLTFPSNFDENIGDHWADYLIERRTIYFDLDYRIVTEGDYKGCLVIPHYFYDKLIGWDYISKSGAYMTATESSESMLLFPSKKPPQQPIIVEGLHDALCFPDTIGTKRAKVTTKQAYHLRNTDPIVLPDRHGSKLYESAKEYGWRVCIPSWKEKDLNAAVMNHGILVVARKIYEGTMKIGPKSDVLYKRWTHTK